MYPTYSLKWNLGGSINNPRFFLGLEAKAKQVTGACFPERVAPQSIPGTREQSAAPDSHSQAGRGDIGRVQVMGQDANSP